MSGNTHLNAPKQSRSRRTLERIVQAALRILEDQGHKALTVKAVVEEANSSVGSFYARFNGKEDLVDYLGEKVWDQALQRWDAAVAARDWTEIDLQDIAEGSMGLLVDIGASRAVYLRALDQVRGTDGQAYSRFRDQLLGDIAAILLARRQEINHPKPEFAVRLGLLAAEGMIVAGRAEELDPLPREVLAEEATDLLLCYLWSKTSARSAGRISEEVDFFDVWS